MNWLRRLINRLSTPQALHVALQKRRLQRIAQEAGAPRAMAVKIASLFFKSDLEKGS